MWKKIQNFVLNLLYPQFCFNCGQEATSYLCEDCKSTLEILQSHQKYSSQKGEENKFSSSPFAVARDLKDLYFALPYQNLLIKNLIQKFKYQPFVKELAIPLTSLIITHFQLLDNKPNFSDYILIPVPLEKRKLKWRGFNQAEEIGKELSKFLKISLLNNVLAKIKETPSQVELSDEERKENIKGVFLVKDEELIKNRKILLIDDIYTTGATMEECARVLKTAGAKEIIGIVVARG